MANLAILCEDMLMEIFLRLPAESIGKFRYLSKTWRTNLSTSRFINLHLITKKTKQPKLFLRKNDEPLYVLTFAEDGRATVSNKVKLPITRRVRTVNSCNGLVLLHDEFEMILVNPITMKHVIVPTPSGLESKSFMSSYNCGFGYDHSSDDYKIVIYYFSRLDGSTIVQVYSVKSKVWRRVNSSPEDPIRSLKRGGAFTNGAIHWSTYCDSRIVAFNLSDEVFYEIPCGDWNFHFHRIHILEGCLCLIDISSIYKKDIWIMKEYGVGDSWTKYTVNSDCKWKIYRPLFFIGDEEIVLLTYDGRVIVYNLVEGTSKDMVVDTDIKRSSLNGITFFDSLVSPDQQWFI